MKSENQKLKTKFGHGKALIVLGFTSLPFYWLQSIENALHLDATCIGWQHSFLLLTFRKTVHSWEVFFFFHLNIKSLEC